MLFVSAEKAIQDCQRDKQIDICHSSSILIAYADLMLHFWNDCLLVLFFTLNVLACFVNHHAPFGRASQKSLEREGLHRVD
jgi:hypothetical protein